MSLLRVPADRDVTVRRTVRLLAPTRHKISFNRDGRFVREYAALVPAQGRASRDCDLRIAVHRALAAAHSDDGRTLVVDEFSVCRARARVDVAVLNGSLSGYELKSDVDRLDRLRSQIPQYGRVFDRMTLVTGTRHASEAGAMVPHWWGLWIAEPGVADAFEVVEVRPAASNPSVCARSVVGLLWHDEMQELLATRDVALRTRSRTRRQLIDAITEAVGPEALRSAVRDMLRLRTQRTLASDPSLAG